MSEPPPGAVLMTNSTGRVGCWADAAPLPAGAPPPGAAGVQLTTTNATARALISPTSRRGARTPPHITGDLRRLQAALWLPVGVQPLRGRTSPGAMLAPLPGLGNSPRRCARF